jgi:hypothetical protein
MSPLSITRSRTVIRTLSLAGALLAAITLTNCAKPETAKQIDTSNGATAPDSQQPAWRALLSSPSLEAWRGYKSDKVPDGWVMQDGVLTKTKPADDLITRDQFGDFELEFEWRLGKGGNAGVFYRGTEEYEHIYWSGPEYQLLDDANAPDGKNRLTSAASAFGIYAPPAGIVKPAGEWNSSRIVAKGAHVEHWLNGQKVVDYELWSPDWEARVKASKFSVWPNYGRSKTGHIGVQGDHNGDLAFRNIRIRELH